MFLVAAGFAATEPTPPLADLRVGPGSMGLFAEQLIRNRVHPNA